MTTAILNAVTVKPFFWLFSRKKPSVCGPIVDPSQLDARTRRAISGLPPYLLKDIGVTDL